MAGIFKAYDIRGLVEPDLSPQRAYLIGRALADEIFNSGNADAPVVVSRDMRTHSPQLSAQLVRGLSEGGCPVLDIGLAATPMNYWANVHYKARGSVQVTASHNGPEYNGFKVSGPNAIPLDYSTGLDKVESWVLAAEAQSTLQVLAAPAAVKTVDDALSPYLDWMLSLAPSIVKADAPQCRIGIDTANGMGGFFLPALSEKLSGIEIVPLYWELDGTFPNHEADPLKAENLEDVQELVKREGCDFGVAFDGDADRCMFVDERGVSVSSDLITAFIAGAVLKEYPNRAILYDLRSSHIVPEWIESHGGTPVRGRVGHSFMKRLLKEKNAPFGGELSGHYYFAACHNTDSGLMAMLQIIAIWRRAQSDNKNLSQLIEPLRKYSATGEINFLVNDIPSTLQRIESYYQDNGTLDHLDGLTVEMPDWWFNLRSSNTEPKLRLNLEAASDAERDAKLKEVKALIENS